MKITGMLFAVVVVFVVPLSPSAAAQHDCLAAQLGWHFYCDPEPEKKAAPEVPPLVVQQPVALPAPAPTPEPSEPPDPREIVKAITEELDTLKARAILEPTEKNIRAYIAFQSQQLDRASVFSDQWRRTIWQNPELDYSLFRPTGTLAKRAWLDERTRLKADTLANLNKRYGVFYFFKGRDCAACAASAPIVRAFIDKHKINAMAISLDGESYPAFTEFTKDAGHAARLGITERFLPALVLFDSNAQKVLPIGYGVIAADELTSRIYTLTQLKLGEDY